MNANELADELEKVVDVMHYASEVLRKEVITMLRQQQAEIEALKKHNATLIWALAQQSNVLGKNKQNELSNWADAEEEAQKDNEQFFKDLKAGNISLKPKAQEK